MGFVLIGDDGLPVQREVPHPLDQLREIFDRLASMAYTSAFCEIIDNGDYTAEEDELVWCGTCSTPNYPHDVDEAGVCQNCHDRELRLILQTLPYERTNADWSRLAELGYVDPDSSVA